MEVAEFVGFIAGYRRKAQEADARHKADEAKRKKALDRDARWAHEIGHLLPLGEGGSVKDAAERIAKAFPEEVAGWEQAEAILKKRRNVPDSALYSPNKPKGRKPVKGKTARKAGSGRRANGPSIEGERHTLRADSRSKKEKH